MDQQSPTNNMDQQSPTNKKAGLRQLLVYLPITIILIILDQITKKIAVDTLSSGRRIPLINGVLEVSYPSSTTLLVMCMMPTALLQLKARIRHPLLRKFVAGAITAFTVFMVVGRLVSGVHWCSDILGGIFLSAGLVEAYRAAAKC